MSERRDDQMIKTRFGPRSVGDVVGWAIVTGVMFGMAGGFFAAWLVGLLAHG